MRRVVLFFILSICFHFLSWSISQYLSLWFSSSKTLPLPNNQFEVSFQEKSADPISKQIVRQSIVPTETEPITEKKESTNLLSELDQRVKVQSKAALFGLTKNRLYNTQKKLQTKLDSQSKTKIVDHFRDEESIKSDSKHKNDSTSSSSLSFQNIPSTVGDLLSESIKVGEITALNTDRYLFYSFYSRVEEAIRYKWEHDVESSINKLNKNQYHNPKSIWSTRLDIFLSSEGKFLKAVLLKESGIHNLDMAAINAFREANFFPHPPKEMIGDDGNIRLEYKFHVFFDPSSPGPLQINL